MVMMMPLKMLEKLLTPLKMRVKMKKIKSKMLKKKNFEDIFEKELLQFFKNKKMLMLKKMKMLKLLKLLTSG